MRKPGSIHLKMTPKITSAPNFATGSLGLVAILYFLYSLVFPDYGERSCRCHYERETRLWAMGADILWGI